MANPGRGELRTVVTRALVMANVALCLSSCATFKPGISEISPFRSDGCSLFPEGTLIDKGLWEECCIEHDIAYWQGGTAAERREADERLRDCIEAKTSDAILAKVMYDAVRAGGSPMFPTWYRWAYGWPMGRQYRPLSEEERRQVTRQLEQYHWSRSQ